MKFLYFFLITLYSFSSFAQDDNMLPYLRLKGKIESVRIIPYEVQEKDDKTIEKNISIGFLYDKNAFIRFNKAGKVIEKIDYNNKNEVTRHRELSYDNKNRCINEKVYNKEGKMTQEISTTYDDKKKESRETDHRRITVCQLDDRGNPINCATFTTEGKLIEKCYTTYDKDNKVLEKVYRTPNNDKKYVFHNEYNDNGYHTKISEDDYVNFTDNIKVNYFYKDAPLPYQQSLSANGTLPAYSDLSYQYDKKGNWIRKEVRYKDKLVFLVELKITYFN
ncbi:hypothetical protein [Capnocytophaga sp. G2]|uniref:hypothetical protein n=1 Tax=Capnocytophaga sp. G2 TaxID=3110695 RepID=UPI002B48C820|nr:hypothetical protein [Capnocytophaga sp. G2]